MPNNTGNDKAVRHDIAQHDKTADHRNLIGLSIGRAALFA